MSYNAGRITADAALTNEIVGHGGPNGPPHVNAADPDSLLEGNNPALPQEDGAGDPRPGKGPKETTSKPGTSPKVPSNLEPEVRTSPKPPNGPKSTAKGPAGFTGGLGVAASKAGLVGMWAGQLAVDFAVQAAIAAQLEWSLNKMSDGKLLRDQSAGVAQMMESFRDGKVDVKKLWKGYWKWELAPLKAMCIGFAKAVKLSWKITLTITGLKHLAKPFKKFGKWLKKKFGHHDDKRDTEGGGEGDPPAVLTASEVETQLLTIIMKAATEFFPEAPGTQHHKREYLPMIAAMGRVV
nr:hypothetical protein B0A51_02022 [Rachicladosporium sp. CCFEE 5018]